ATELDGFGKGLAYGVMPGLSPVAPETNSGKKMTEEHNDAEKDPVEQAGEDLFHYAADREDIKWLMQYLSPEADINRVTVEYELQILKFVSVGWSISYFLENSSNRGRVLALYWQAVREYARNLSDTTNMMTGQEIDYFEVVKQRLDQYVAALSRNSGAPEPGSVIGPEFAGVCGNENDIVTSMTGSKLFLGILANVRKYLEAMEV
ncbi:MAG TPA: hypothetical protein VKO20_02035, partial [Desulfosalsimonadaceae bacterium]|nr:hypothetical protein [Desulfosalsimonadaceae bacterium]